MLDTSRIGDRAQDS